MTCSHRRSLSARSVRALCRGLAVVVAVFAAPLAAEDVRLTYDSRGNIVAIEDASVASTLRVQRFAPGYGRPGDSLTIVGAGFSTTPSSNHVTIGGVSATVTAAAADHLKVTVPTGVASGPVTVTVSAATATSTQNFTVLPSALIAADVVTGTEMTIDAPAVRVNTLANRYALASFAGQSGDLLSFQFAQLDLPALGSATYQVFNPAGSQIASGTLYETTRSIHLPALATSGHHALYVTSTVTLRTQLALESAAVITIDGVATQSGTTFRGQSRRLRFAGTSGQNLGFAMNDQTAAPGGAYLLAPVFYKPDGSALATLSNLPQTGNYTVIVKTDASATQTGFKAWLSNDLTGTLTINQLTTATVTRPGQAYRYTFSGTAGQRLRLGTGGVSTSPSGQRVAIYVYKPDGSCLDPTCPISATAAVWTYNLPVLPVSGTYTVLVDINPYDNNAATFSSPFTLAEDVAATLAIDGTETSVATTAHGQVIRATFAGTAGQNLGFAYTDLSLIPSGAYVATVAYYAPNGTQLTSLTNLPQTGTYTVLLSPSHDTTQSSMKLWLSSEATGMLTAGSTVTVAAARPGQAARFTYAGTAGQQLRMATASTATTPASQRISISIYKPDGSCLDVNCYYNVTTTSGHVDLPALPATGNYTFLADINVYDNQSATFTTNVTLTVLNP